MATPKDIDNAERTLKEQLRKVRAVKKGLPLDGSILDTQADLSRHYKVERSTIHTWIQKGMPGEPGNYVIADIDNWRKAQQDEDALLSSAVNSPWLEELRKNKALQEEIKLNLMRGSVVEIARMQDCLALWSATIRRMQERLSRKFGREAADIVDDALDDCGRALKPLFECTDDNHTGHPDQQPGRVSAADAAPEKATGNNAHKRKGAKPKNDKPVGRKRANPPKRTVQRRKIQTPKASSQPIVVRGFGLAAMEPLSGDRPDPKRQNPDVLRGANPLPPIRVAGDGHHRAADNANGPGQMD